MSFLVGGSEKSYPEREPCSPIAFCFTLPLFTVRVVSERTGGGDFCRFESRLRKCKEKHCRCTGVLVNPKARWSSGHYTDVLLAADFIGHDAAANGASGVE